MSQIIVDPSELRQFGLALRELRHEISGRSKLLGGQINDIKKFWDDEKYKDFQRSSEKMLSELQHFVKQCDQYYEYLMKKSAAAEAYLGR